MHADHDHPKIDSELRDIFRGEYPRRLPWRPDAIKNIRLARGYNQTQLAQLTGVKQETISALQTDRNRRRLMQKRGLTGTGQDIVVTHDTVQLYAIAATLKCKFEEIAVLPPATDAEITADQIRQHHSLLHDVERVTTLIRPGEKTFVRDIYLRTLLQDRAFRTPTAPLSAGARSQAFEADLVSSLPSTACVILGTAGQGKSIFLRHLAIQEVIHATTLPLFFELRQFPDEPVHEVVLRRLRQLELIDSHAQCNQILVKGQVTLLFDAFDELAFERRGGFVSELRELHRDFPQTRIVLTSRPESGILASDWLHPCSILPLKRTDVESLIRIYARDTEADHIVTLVREADFEVIDLLRAPIFVVLLVIQYEYSRTIPDNLVAFYRDLFDALIRRQNSGEVGLMREIHSGLSQLLLEKVFRAISFLAHKQFGDQPIHIRDLETLAERVIQTQSLQKDAAPLVIADIVSITNLIAEEAGNCSYIHKSVREFYAADHVANAATAEQAATFYHSMMTHWRNWMGVLRFAERLDHLRYLQGFAVPGLRRFAPFDAVSIANSFRKLVVSRNDDEEFPYNVALEESECHQFCDESMISYGATCTAADLTTVFGASQAAEIVERLKKQVDVICERDEVRKGLPSGQLNYEPILEQIAQHLQGDGFQEQLTAWEAEVQQRHPLDSDYKIR